jgi:biopolymer transport protein ExbD
MMRAVCGLLSVPLALLALIGCHGAKSQQSFPEGVQALCDLPDHVPDDGQRYDRRLAAVRDWAEQHVTNVEAKQISAFDSGTDNRTALAEAVKKAGIVKCRLLDNGLELQPYAEAMQVVCNAPANASASGYFGSHLLNVEVVRAFARLGDVDPMEQVERLRAMVERARLASCPALDAATSRAEHVPTVPAVGLDKPDVAPTLIATASSIAVEGHPILAVHDGKIDPAELEGGEAGILIPRLRTILTSLVQQSEQAGYKDPRTGVLSFRDKLAPLNLVLDPATPYRTLCSVMFTAKQAGFREFAVAVRAGRELAAIPLSLPDKVRFGAPPPPGVRPVVSVMNGRLRLWSLSGLEGTLQKPALDVTLDHVADVQKQLIEIVARRHPRDDERQILVMADGAVPMQNIAEVMAAIRSDDGGHPLFPAILLSSGFE